MKVLFDVNMPRPLRRELPGHEIFTAQSMGWNELENGDLISAAEKGGFDALVTADKNLRYQQNLSGRKIAILVLPGNKLKVLRRIVSAIRAAMDSLKPGDFVEIEAD
jgi:predicted nuclease of predicted toxin-antitoxin system